MRINPDATADLLAQLRYSQASESLALQQLSSGRRVAAPSEDPAAISAMIQDAARRSRDDQYSQGIATIRDSMSIADSSLGSVVVSLQRAISLGIEGATSTQSAANREAIATDVSGIFDEVLGVANLSYRNTNLFSGTEDKTPYVRDNTSSSGVQYVGNDNVIRVQVSESLTVQANCPGSQLFSAPGADVFASLQELQASLNANDPARIQAATAQVRAAYDHVTAARATFGNTMNQLDSSSQFLDAEKLNLKTRETLLVGADPAEAVINLKQAQFARDATLAAVGQRSGLSLLDHLR
jgi:flagellar hook-associated protein 3 FlgL